MATVKVNNIIRKLFVEHEGKLVEVKDNIDPSDYPKGVTIYTKEAAKGKDKGAPLYAVAVEDFIPKKRKSSKESIQSMLANGMTAEEIVAKLAGL